jgi:hypothetical protein
MPKLNNNQWLNRYRGELLSRTGLEQNDTFEDDELLLFKKDGKTPEEVVDMVVDKRELMDFKHEPWEADTYNRFRKQALERFGYAPSARSY